MKARGVNKTVRLWGHGIPNVGKSTFINRLYGANVTKASDRPGVTRAKQWVKVGNYLELLDTPACSGPSWRISRWPRNWPFWGRSGIRSWTARSWPGALLARLMAVAPEATAARFKIRTEEGEEPLPERLLELACKGRGWLLSGAQGPTPPGGRRWFWTNSGAERSDASPWIRFRSGSDGRRRTLNMATRETAREKLIRLTRIERELWARGEQVAGMDEVGRGPFGRAGGDGPVS